MANHSAKPGATPSRSYTASTPSLKRVAEQTTPRPRGWSSSDEAQRAWSTDKMQKMQKRQRRFNDSNGLPSPEGDVESEPQSLLSIMGRRPGSVIVALCGGGQEIHDGEAGIDEWLRAAENLEDWEVVSSPMVETALRSKLGPRFGSSQLLHLDVPLRSHRSSGHAEWVDAVLEGNCERARAENR